MYNIKKHVNFKKKINEIIKLFIFKWLNQKLKISNFKKKINNI